MEYKVFGILGIGLFGLIIILTITNEIICRYYLAKLAERYKNGIDIGCVNLEELKEKLMAILGQDILIMENYVLVKEKNAEYVFFLENGRVMAEYPIEKTSYSKASKSINSFLRVFKLTKAMSISRIMDRIATKYNSEVKTEEPKTYVKVRRVYKGIIFAYIISVVVIISIIAWSFLMKSDNMIKAVKNASPKKYPDCTYGKAFESFFANAEWSLAESGKTSNVVEFTGDAYFVDEKSNFLVRFNVDEIGKYISVAVIKIDGKRVEEVVANNILETIFDECANNKKENIKKTISQVEKPKEEKKKVKKTEKIKKKKNTTTKNKPTSYSEDELIDAAIKYYCAVKGVNHISAMVDGGDRDNIMIRLFEDGTDMISTSDWYTVNVYTGQGTDFNGNYIDIMNPPETSANSYTGDEYIFPNSDSAYLTDYDLQGMTLEECRLARNEIYARHGRMFKDKALQNYFDSKSWYTPSVRPEDFNEHWLNEYEKANAKLIKSFE